MNRHQKEHTYRDGLTEAQASLRSQSKTTPTLKLNVLTTVERTIAERDGLEVRKICVKVESETNWSVRRRAFF